jgi:uncharacterized protein
VSALEALAVLAAGIGAGIVNTVVGSGTLITFPVLLFVGYSPFTANVSNSLGLVPGSVSGAYGYRRELRGQRSRIVRFGLVSAIGAGTGAALLLALPASAFAAIVPFFIALALALVIAQPRLNRWLIRRRGDDHPADGGRLAIALDYGSAVYGGYFGAAQGVILLALLGIFIADDLQRLNGVKNVLAAIANGVAALVFVFAADVAWDVAALIAVGSIAGAQFGAFFGRRIPAPLLRAVIVIVGVIAAIKLIVDP